MYGKDPILMEKLYKVRGIAPMGNLLMRLKALVGLMQLSQVIGVL